jgi:hypothetical protein
MSSTIASIAATIARTPYHVRGTPKNPKAFFRVFADSLVTYGFPRPSRAHFERAVKRRPRFLYNRPEALAQRLAILADVLQLPKAKLLRCAMGFNGILLVKPATVDSHVTENATRLGVTLDDYKRLALCCPMLFVMQARTVEARRNRLAALLGLDQEGVMRVARKSPHLLFRAPKTLAANIKEIVALLGISRASAIRLFIKQPTVLEFRPASLKAKISHGATAFGISRERFVLACVKNPSLLSRNSVALAQATRRMANHLELEMNDFIEIALRQPAMLTLNPSTVAQKFKILCELAVINGNVQSPLAIVRQLPASLCYSAEHLRRCAKLLKVSPGRASLACILTYPAARMEQLITSRSIP